MDGDISKRLSIILVIAVVLISAVSTWMIIDSSFDQPEGRPGNALLKLFIKDAPVSPSFSDSNSGQARVVIAKRGG